MSRRYLTFLSIDLSKQDTLPSRNKQRDIEEAVDAAGYNFENFDWTAWSNGGASCVAQGENTLGGGMREEDASREIHAAIWGALGKFADIDVGWVYIESPDSWHKGTEEECREVLKDRGVLDCLRIKPEL
jgi:hypothetical protein